MANYLSPGVFVSEVDLTTVVPAVSTTEGAIAGVFRWGPVSQAQLISSETQLASVFGKPTNLNAETWFSAANFLAYSNKLYVARADSTISFNAIANTGEANVEAHVIKNDDAYDGVAENFDADVQYIAKYPGLLGNSLKVSVCDSPAQYSSSILGDINFEVNSDTATVTVANSTVFAASVSTGDIIEANDPTAGKQFLKVSDVLIVNTTVAEVTFTEVFKLSSNVSMTTIERRWEYFDRVAIAPGQSDYVAAVGNTSANDELHVVVADEDGQFTGVPGQILEVYAGLSRATDAKTADGAALYYKTVINQQSPFVWVASDRSTAVSNVAIDVASSSATAPLTLSFVGGTDSASEANATFSSIALAYDLFNSTQTTDVSLIIAGKSIGGTHGEQLANYLIDNIAEVRKDCVVFVSPARDDVVDNTDDVSADVIEFRNALRSTSYAFLDSGYKYQYDKYNDLYRYIPLNGDIAGIVARSDQTNDPWYSPAGSTRGQVKNAIRLAYNPGQADRDVLYKAGVNPVVTFPGQGSMLYGDKTLLKKPSAFDRINVRRLFIVMEKSISVAAESILFEFNDEFTRQQFKSLVEPYLREIKGRRGIFDFKVVCDATNNTGQVIDTNRLVCDIYVKPARSVNFVQLNFIAVRTGVEFAEIVGTF